jgi:hypothetical protein
VKLRSNDAIIPVASLRQHCAGTTGCWAEVRPLAAEIGGNADEVMVEGAASREPAVECHVGQGDECRAGGEQFNRWLERSHEERFRAFEPLPCKLGFYPLENDAEKCEWFSATRPKIILL